jgi:arabinofuranosyltransferase
VALSRPFLISAEPLRGVFTGSIKETLLGKPALFGVLLIGDERQYYAQLWLLPTIQGKHQPNQFSWARQGQRWREFRGYFNVRGTIGMFGYYAGQQVYVVDLFALSDAFLARVKQLPTPKHWMIGHVARPIPEGYLMTKFTGENKIINREAREFYEKL